VAKVYRPAEIESLLQGVVAVVFEAQAKGVDLTVELDLTLEVDRDREGHLSLGLQADADLPTGSVPVKASGQAGAGRKTSRAGDHELRLALTASTRYEGGGE
jgi:hypothetical protein